MLCGKPVTLPFPYKDRVVPCGQCIACRINQRRKWTCRILLEAAQCAESIFVTMTYDDDHVPMAVCDGSPEQVLVPKHLTLFIKSLRQTRMGKIRFFACGEYGNKTQRPHYHLVLFGKHLNLENEALLHNTWGKGFVSVSDLNPQRAAYIAGYVMKKWTKADNRKLHGRPPEFTRMSRRPGIGANAIPYLANMYRRRDGAKALADRGDIEACVRIHGKIYPLDHFMRSKMREELDIPPLQADRILVKWGKEGPPPMEPPDYEKAAKTLHILEIKAGIPTRDTL